jgi:hypothetical protein
MTCTFFHLACRLKPKPNELFQLCACARGTTNARRQRDTPPGAKPHQTISEEDIPRVCRHPEVGGEEGTRARCQPTRRAAAHAARTFGSRRMGSGPTHSPSRRCRVRLRSRRPSPHRHDTFGCPPLPSATPPPSAVRTHPHFFFIESAPHFGKPTENPAPRKKLA